MISASAMLTRANSRQRQVLGYRLGLKRFDEALGRIEQVGLQALHLRLVLVAQTLHRGALRKRQMQVLGVVDDGRGRRQRAAHPVFHLPGERNLRQRERGDEGYGPGKFRATCARAMRITGRAPLRWPRAPGAGVAPHVAGGRRQQEVARHLGRDVHHDFGNRGRRTRRRRQRGYPCEHREQARGRRDRSRVRATQGARDRGRSSRRSNEGASARSALRRDAKRRRSALSSRPGSICFTPFLQGRHPTPRARRPCPVHSGCAPYLARCPASVPPRRC